MSAQPISCFLVDELRVTTTRLNPFPDFAVVRLDDKSLIASGRTVETEPIRLARALVDRRVAAAKDERTATIVAVKGDFGTGKTHLLLDARDWLLRKRRDAGALCLTATETDPVDWFRGSVGPALPIDFLKSAATKTFALSAAAIARAAPRREDRATRRTPARDYRTRS